MKLIASVLVGLLVAVLGYEVSASPSPSKTDSAALTSGPAALVSTVADPAATRQQEGDDPVPVPKPVEPDCDELCAALAAAEAALATAEQAVASATTALAAAEEARRDALGEWDRAEELERLQSAADEICATGTYAECQAALDAIDAQQVVVNDARDAYTRAAAAEDAAAEALDAAEDARDAAEDTRDAAQAAVNAARCNCG